MASVLQTVFSLPDFSTRYLLPFPAHVLTCPIEDPANCVECQMGKVADGLLSGRYAIPRTLASDEPAGTPTFQEGVRPNDFKSLIGKGHPEFATMRQQDAAEFLGHLFRTLQGSSKRHGLDDITKSFRYLVEQKIKCDQCGGVRLRSDEEDKLTLIVPAIEKVASSDTMEVDVSADKGKEPVEGEGKKAEPAKVEFETVELTSLLDSFVEPRSLDEYRCPKCDKKVTATQCVLRPSSLKALLQTMSTGPFASPPFPTSSSSTLLAFVSTTGSSRSWTSRFRCRLRSRSISTWRRASSTARRSCPRSRQVRTLHPASCLLPNDTLAQIRRPSCQSSMLPPWRRSPAWAFPRLDVRRLSLQRATRTPMPQ